MTIWSTHSVVKYSKTITAQQYSQHIQHMHEHLDLDPSSGK